MDQEVRQEVNVKPSTKILEIRQKIRENVASTRELHRLTAIDSNRFIAEQITEKDISGLAGRIKRRKQATAEDLVKLGHAFLQNQSNISVFMKITGASNVIIKEFTGNNGNQQLLAAQCLCNLSMGDEISCAKLSSSIGTYLIMYVHSSTNIILTKICLWIIQNLIASGPKPLEILLAQELVKTCLRVMDQPINSEIGHEGIQLIELIIAEKWTQLAIDEKSDIIQKTIHITKINCHDPPTLQLLHRVLSADGWNLPPQEAQVILQLMIKNLFTWNDLEGLALHHTIRIIALSFIDNERITQFLESLIVSEKMLSSIINDILKVPKFFDEGKELIWLCGKIIATQLPAVSTYLSFDNLINNLQISEFFKF